MWEVTRKASQLLERRPTVHVATVAGNHFRQVGGMTDLECVDHGRLDQIRRLLVRQAVADDLDDHLAARRVDLRDRPSFRLPFRSRTLSACLACW
jgi:hypothetical protein